jgi:adenylate cyclase
MAAGKVPAWSRVRFSLRWKITLPFMLLALVLGIGATVLLNRLMQESEETRFLRQLADSGQQASDAVVRVEADLLEVERLIANTEGVAEAAGSGDAESLRQRVLPLAINSGVDVVAVIDSSASSLLSVRRAPDSPPGEYTSERGEAFYSQWGFVSEILQGVHDEGVGDKRVGLESIRLGDQSPYVFFVGGPLRSPAGDVIGAVLVGQYLDTLVDGLGSQAGANVAIYQLETGELLKTGLESASADASRLAPDLLAEVTAQGSTATPVRPLDVAGVAYEEVLLPFVARGGERLGVLGVSLLWAPLGVSIRDNLLMVVSLSALSLALIVLIGLFISGRITRPLVEIAEASVDVATGRLDTRVSERGDDELALLGRTFNYMVEGLREGTIYRDLLGRTMTPEVREQLRKSLVDGRGVLEGQESVATILCADLGGLARIAEERQPREVLKTLHEYYDALIPILAQHGGVVSKFDGESLTAFFGILPRTLPAQVSALQAVHAAMAMLETVTALGEARAEQGMRALDMGIGVSTGPVVAGGVGSKERMHYAVLGDTVSTALRIQQAARELTSGGLLISEDTERYLGSARGQFDFGRTGVAQLRGKRRQVTVYEVRGRRDRLVKPRG